MFGWLPPSIRSSLSAALFRALPLLLLLLSTSACVIDRTGQSRSAAFQQDLARTNSQVQGLQRQVDDQLKNTSQRLVEVEESDKLNRRNLADSGAMLDTMVTEVQSLRGTFEEVARRTDQNGARHEKFQGDVDFRLNEIEKRLVALEKSVTTLAAAVPASDESSADSSGEAGEQLSAEDAYKKARGYFDAGNYKVAAAFLKPYKKRYPTSPQREDAQFLYAEALFKDGAFKNAIPEYQALIEDFPKTSRMPTAMLRMGEGFAALGEKEDARVFYDELVKAFPKTPEADAARAHIKELK